MSQLPDLGDAPSEGHGPVLALLVSPLVVLLAFVCLVAISWTGWGVETDPAAQVMRDAPWIVLAGLSGAGAGAVLAWSLVGGRRRVVTVGAALGALPAVVLVTAYFTDAY